MLFTKRNIPTDIIDLLRLKTSQRYLRSIDNEYSIYNNIIGAS